MISTTGLSPETAAPTASPAMAASETGVVSWIIRLVEFSLVKPLLDRAV